MRHLLLDLAVVECRLAALALAAREAAVGAQLLSRAAWLLRLRNASTLTLHSSLDAGAPGG